MNSNLNEEKTQAIIQMPCNEIGEVSSKFRNQKLFHEVHHYDSYSEILVPINAHESRRKFMSLMKTLSFNHVLIKYDFNHLERSVEKRWKDGFTYAINQEHNQSFTNAQSAMKFYVDLELERLSVHENFQNTPLYYSLLNTLMAEFINRAGRLTGPGFIAYEPVEGFAKFYHSLEQREAKRLHALTIDALIRIGYKVF